MLALVLTVVLSAWLTAALARPHRWLLLAMMLASPVVVMPAYVVGQAVAGYASGTAVVMQSGLLSHFPPRGLHPRLRIPIRRTGCVVTDMSEMVESINNATLELLVATLGPMPGSYLGPLPDRAPRLTPAECAGLTRLEDQYRCISGIRSKSP